MRGTPPPPDHVVKIAAAHRDCRRAGLRECLERVPNRGSHRARREVPPWTPGMLDIHHIDTGVGTATFILGPDGTTMLIDCSATGGGPPASTPLRPNDTWSAGEWVARYVLRHAGAAGRTTLDYMIATHVHPDHVGSPPVAGNVSRKSGCLRADADMIASVYT